MYLMALFQSLVGKLETMHFSSNFLMCSQFQSLVGKLETLHAFVPAEVRCPFQSLVGKLETYYTQSLLSSAYESFNPL